MSDAIQNYLPYVAGAALGLGLLLFLVSLRLFRRSRSDVYWRRRRDAGQRGWRIFVLSFALFVVGGMSCIVTLFVHLVADEEKKPTQVTVQNPVTTATTGPAIDTPPAPTNAANTVPAVPENQTPPDTSPTPVVVIITTTPVYTPTETPFPTFTPHVTPPVSNVTPRPNASLRITSLDDDISDTLTPPNPRTTFEAGVTRIYLFVEFQGMTEGVLWKRYLYRDGEQIDGGSYLWGLETSGTTYFFFGNDSGFPPGTYEIRLYIDNAPLPATAVPFVITDAP